MQIRGLERPDRGARRGACIMGRPVKKPLDPYAYIESAFLDRTAKPKADKPAEARGRFKKTQMLAPRPRRKAVTTGALDADTRAIWEQLPKNVEFLTQFFDDSATARYYRGEFKESRVELIRRLLDPELNLEEVSRLLGVVPATVRRYTDRGWLQHHRTRGGQRRFRLSDVVRFVNEHGRFPEG